MKMKRPKIAQNCSKGETKRYEMVSMTQNSTERHRIAQKVKKMFKNGLKEAQNGTERHRMSLKC